MMNSHIRPGCNMWGNMVLKSIFRLKCCRKSLHPNVKYLMLILNKCPMICVSINPKPKTDFYMIPAVAKCDPGRGDASCCTKSNQCKEGEGDCDADSQCTGNLVCGKDNCKKWNPAAHALFDCCEGNLYY